MSLNFTILGCGSSAGVPRVGQGWGQCDPNNPKNRRRRCSILVEKGEGEAKTKILIDMSPDLREQLLNAEIRHLDAILLTHPHADHVHGIDEIRPLVLMARRKIDLYMDAATAARVRVNFGYIFETPPGSQYPALLSEHRLFAGQTISLIGSGGTIEATPFQLEHGEINALGFRIGCVAYTPDVNAIPDESVAFLEGLDLWIVDALRYKPHPSHFCLADTLAWIERLKPRRAVLTNLHSDLDFERLRQELPPYIEPAFDGLELFC
ncbi:MAG: MBL fold metallo-hydrolase [Alphaproteobacteria bacterium]|nr:MBL fold metallo-hydrolase [Alphaproteobacteria bacterium]